MIKIKTRSQSQDPKVLPPSHLNEDRVVPELGEVDDRDEGGDGPGQAAVGEEGQGGGHA